MLTGFLNPKPSCFGIKIWHLRARGYSRTGNASLTVSSSTSLKALQLQVLEKFDAHPLDQVRHEGRKWAQVDSHREVETPLPSNSPHYHMILRVDLVRSHGRWKRPCLPANPQRDPRWCHNNLNNIPYCARAVLAPAARVDTPAKAELLTAEILRSLN